MPYTSIITSRIYRDCNGKRISQVVDQIVKRKVSTKIINRSTIFDPNGTPSLMEKTSLELKNGAYNYYNFSVNAAGIATQQTSDATGKITTITRDLSSFVRLFFQKIN